MEISKNLRLYAVCPVDDTTSASVGSCPRLQSSRSSKNELKAEPASHQAVEGAGCNWDDSSEFTSLTRTGSACSSNFRDDFYDISAWEDGLFRKLQKLRNLYLRDLWDILRSFKKRLHEYRHDPAITCVINCHIDILERMIVLLVVPRDNLPSWLEEQSVSTLKHQTLQYLKILKGDKFDAGLERVVARHLRTCCPHSCE